MAIFPNPLPSFHRLKRLIVLFFHSSIFMPSLAMFLLLMALLAGQAWLNKSNNSIYGDVMTAITAGDSKKYAKLVSFFMLFFGLLTVIGVAFRFLEEQLGLLLRKGLTQYLIGDYLTDRAYLRLLDRKDVDNPDQRITEDVKTLTTNALSFVLVVLRATVNFFVFSHVLQGITGSLVWAAAACAAFGSVVTVVIGKRLVGLNIEQLQKEADLRYELVRTRDHAAAIALQRDELRQGPRLLGRLYTVVENMRRIITRNAFLNLFTTAYGYAIIVVPIVIVAPLVFRRELPIGKVTQAIDAFRFVVDAFSVLITEFPRLSLLTAVVARLGELVSAIHTPPKANGLHVEVDGDLLEVRDLILKDPVDGHEFFSGHQVNFRIEPGQHTLIVGAPGTGKRELLRALAGLWSTGSGNIIRPQLDHIAFVTPQPYLTPSTLRQLMTPFGATIASSDQELTDLLASLRLSEIIHRIGGLDKERDWDATLALGERQTIALARLLILRPRFAVLNEVTNALDGDTRRAYYKKLEEAGVTVVTLASRRILPEFHKRQLVLPGEGNSLAGPTAA